MLRAEVIDERGDEVYVALSRVEKPILVTGMWLPREDADAMIRQLTLGIEMAAGARDFVTMTLDAGGMSLTMLESAPIGTEVTNRHGLTATKMSDPFCGDSWHVEGEHALDRHPSNWMLNEFPEHQMVGA